MLAGIGCLVLLLVLLFGAALLNWTNQPSDEALLSNFHKNKAKFEQLVGMIQEDEGLDSVDPGSTWPLNPADVGITQERLDAYRSLFVELDIPGGFSSYYGPTKIRFFASMSGLTYTERRFKGYAYWEEKPDLVVENDLVRENLEDYRPPTGGSFMVFQHIEGPWYLYYEYFAG